MIFPQIIYGEKTIAYKSKRAHQSRIINKRTPYLDFMDGIKIDEKDINSAT